MNTNFISDLVYQVTAISSHNCSFPVPFFSDYFELLVDVHKNPALHKVPRLYTI